MIEAIYIQNLRKKNDLSQGFLAARLGISRPTYVQIEKGERELTISEAEKLAQVYGLTIMDLLAGRDEAMTVSLVREKGAKYQKDKSFEIRVQKKDLEKFKQVLLYILGRVGARPNVGETVIYKLLYFIDFDYYELYEENLIGATYIKNHFGPTPVEFKTIAREMIEKGEIEKVRSKHFQYEQTKYLPLCAPDLACLSAREIKLIDEVLDRLASRSDEELSDFSHSDNPWMIHEDGEVIAYESVFYRDEGHSVRSCR